MCGIAGMVVADGVAEVGEAAQRMCDSMAHRGPDDEGVLPIALGERTVGLCARRLAIQDCSPRGHQPMTSAATDNAVVLNGELYNVGELRDELERLGHSFDGHSDTEVLLRGWDQWGRGVVARLRGMFAFAVWDAGARELVIARDRLGIKPLYYRADGGDLVFGSEVRTLLESGRVSSRLSPEGVASFLSLGSFQDPLTALEGIRSLPAGHLGIWRESGFREEQYWSLETAFHGAARNGDRAAAVAELREVLEDAARLHLVSDVPLGVFLSGGIDSSALVGLVAAVADAPPRTASVVFPQAEYSEDRYIGLVRERFGTEHFQVRLENEEVRATLPGAVAAMDQPSFDGVNTYIVSQLARRQAGLTVALSGLGGDELFGGYDTFSLVPRLMRLRESVPAGVARGGARVVERAAKGADRGEKLARWLRGEDGETSAYALKRELFSPALVGQLLTAPVADTHAPAQPDGGGDLINTLSRLELSVYMRNVLLRDSDVMSMAHGLEIRVPFLDHRVVEAAAGMPGAWKRGRKPPKSLLVDAVGDLLPPEIVKRPKKGFALPIEHWLRGPLKEQVESVLLDPARGGQAAELLSHAAVVDVWSRFTDGKAHWKRPWSLYVLKEWAERHAA